MPRVVKFSTMFPKEHPRAGAKTGFVEKMWAGLLPIYGKELMYQYLEPMEGKLWDIKFVEWIVKNNLSPKITTIRGSAYGLKEGGLFSPRVWTGKPYDSDQYQFAPDLTVTGIFDVKIDMTKDFGIYLPLQEMFLERSKVAANDGLTTTDFTGWFPSKFEGKIIMWDKNPYQ